MTMKIRKCTQSDKEEIYKIINQAAVIYKGIIPDDRYHEPYMPMENLNQEMQKMSFFGYEENNQLVGIMGFQPVKDVTLIRHAYVLPERQGQGIGSLLLEHLKDLTETNWLMVGTWATASWAIRFYQKRGFHKLEKKDEYLRKYWNIPERQVETSVVLGMKLKNE